LRFNQKILLTGEKKVATQPNAESLTDFLEKASYNRLKKTLQETAGLNCNGYREEYLRRRFEIRLRASGAGTYGKYLLYLKKNPDELKKLLNDLTVNYTMFFRDTDVYEYLEKVLLPKLCRSQNPIRIWSAGCASGEEPYSLAIMLHKILGKAIDKRLVTIFASDIDKEALAQASKGEYQPKQLCKLDAASLDRFFIKNEATYTVKGFVKANIRFEQFDLMTEPLHKNLDLVLCRNVMIYFSRESQQQIHMKFYNALKEGGYFVSGKSEILSGEPNERFLPIDSPTRVYQKPSKPKETEFAVFSPKNAVVTS
jgi:chemotaxis protein methyltransferase CheR